MKKNGVETESRKRLPPFFFAGLHGFIKPAEKYGGIRFAAARVNENFFSGIQFVNEIAADIVIVEYGTLEAIRPEEFAEAAE